MRNIIIAGNWKMNGSLALIESFARTFANTQTTAKAVILPSFVYLDKAHTSFTHTPLILGAQNLSTEPKGAFTGEIAGSMLKECGCQYVLVGHSERRQYYQESNEIVAQKFWQAQQNDLVPILCVGESATQYQQNLTEQMIGEQLQAVMDKVGIQAFTHAVVAYEPIWAIGTGLTATPDQAQQVHAFVRHFFAKQNKDVANALQILYGGSVKSDNTAALLAMADIDGVLVGGASLMVEEFSKMIAIASDLKDNN